MSWDERWAVRTVNGRVVDIGLPTRLRACFRRGSGDVQVTIGYRIIALWIRCVGRRSCGSGMARCCLDGIL